MRNKKLARDSKGIASLAIVGIIVVVAVIVIGIVVATHGKSTTSTKSDTSDQIQNTEVKPAAGTKSISDATFSSPLDASTATKFAADQLTAINKSLSDSGTQFFTATGGYSFAIGSSASAIEWGTTLKSANPADLKSYLESSAKQNGSNVTVNFGNNSTEQVKGSDGKSYDVTCYALNETSGGKTVYASGCLGDAQKSSVYLLAQGDSAATAKQNLDDLLSGTTLTLQ